MGLLVFFNGWRIWVTFVILTVTGHRNFQQYCDANLYLYSSHKRSEIVCGRMIRLPDSDAMSLAPPTKPIDNRMGL